VATAIAEALGNDELVDNAAAINLDTSLQRLDNVIIQSKLENFYN
jgi:hypothetical protein